MILLTISGLPTLRWVDFLDIIVVTFLLYEVYILIRGTNALKIIAGLFAVFLLWKVVNILEMKMLSEILGQFISVGAIALIIVFHPEIRKFLQLLGSKSVFNKRNKNRFWAKFMPKPVQDDRIVSPIVLACQHMANTKTGALIIICEKNHLESIIATGEVFLADVHPLVIETIFFKNTPLHDGALVIADGKIRAARCILPVSAKKDIPSSMGLRHRSAIGVTEQYDCVAVVVSEQTGKISFVKDGAISVNLTPASLQEKLNEELQIQ